VRGLHRLAAFALCNLVANHVGNKRLARKAGCVREMATLLRTSPVLEVQDAAAACIYNIACKTDKEEVQYFNFSFYRGPIFNT
jgi:hypothetical protein